MEVLPGTLTAGLTFDRLVTLAAYKPADGWVLTVALRGAGVIDLTGTADGDGHRLAAAATTTATWAAGRYKYTARVSKDGAVHEIEAGSLEILANLAAVTGTTDVRTHAEIVLDNIEAVLERRATQDQEKYRINNRELWRTPLAELLKLKTTYMELVRLEKARKAGHRFGRSVKVRFK